MSAMARPPSGVAMGVPGEAQTGGKQLSPRQFQTPSWQTTEKSARTFPPHALPTQLVPASREQGVPAFGTTEGHGAASSTFARQFGGSPPFSQVQSVPSG